MVLQKLLVLNSIIQSSKNPTYVTRSTLWKLGVTFLRKYWVAFSVGCPKDKKTKTPPQKKKKKKKKKKVYRKVLSLGDGSQNNKFSLVKKQ